MASVSRRIRRNLVARTVHRTWNGLRIWQTKTAYVVYELARVLKKPVTVQYAPST